MAWQPYMSMQAAQEARQGAAATESFRNEVVRFQDEIYERAEAERTRLRGGMPAFTHTPQRRL